MMVVKESENFTDYNNEDRYLAKSENKEDPGNANTDPSTNETTGV